MGPWWKQESVVFWSQWDWSKHVSGLVQGHSIHGWNKGKHGYSLLSGKQWRSFVWRNHERSQDQCDRCQPDSRLHSQRIWSDRTSSKTRLLCLSVNSSAQTTRTSVPLWNTNLEFSCGSDLLVSLLAQRLSDLRRAHRRYSPSDNKVIPACCRVFRPYTTTHGIDEWKSSTIVRVPPLANDDSWSTRRRV